MCSFSRIPISITILDHTTSASDQYRRFVTTMFDYSGLKKYIFVGKTDSPDLDYACFGYHHDDKPVIILNETRSDQMSRHSVIFILAHDIGHYGNHDIGDPVLTQEMELNADHHNDLGVAEMAFVI